MKSVSRLMMIIALTLCGLTSLAEAAPNGTLLTFAEWRTKHIKDAQQHKQKVEAQIKQLNIQEFLASKTRDAERKRLNLDLEEARNQLAVTEAFTVNDYFVHYLTVQTDLKTAFQFATESLSKEDLAVLLSGYHENLNKKESALGSLSLSKPAGRLQ